jgi:hypothetical protein
MISRIAIVAPTRTVKMGRVCEHLVVVYHQQEPI